MCVWPCNAARDQLEVPLDLSTLIITMSSYSICTAPPTKHPAIEPFFAVASSRDAVYVCVATRPSHRIDRSHSSQIMTAVSGRPRR